MNQFCKSDEQILYEVADATWRCEAAKLLRRSTQDPALSQLTEARGESDSLLRTAYEVRMRALAEWQRNQRMAATIKSILTDMDADTV